jgi:hypothetical protein
MFAARISVGVPISCRLPTEGRQLYENCEWYRECNNSACQNSQAILLSKWVLDNALLCLQIIFHPSGKTSVPLARHRYDADALGGDEASVDRSDDGNDSAGTVGSGRPPKVDNMLHGLSEALTRYLNVRSNNREAAGGCWCEEVVVGLLK